MEERCVETAFDEGITPIACGEDVIVLLFPLGSFVFD